MKAVVSVCDHSGEWSRPYVDRGYFVLRVDPKHGDYTLKDGKALASDAATFDCNRMDDYGWGIGLTAGEFADYCETRENFVGQIYRALGGGMLLSPFEIAGVLLAPPCTDFSVSGARWFAGKDADGRTAESVAIVRDCLRIVRALDPTFWALENPKGRIARLVPELGKWGMHFNPADYAGHADHPEREAYSKDTYLWGNFNPDLPKAERDIVWFYDNAGNRGSWQWKHLGGKSERTKELRSVTPQGFSRAFAAANPG